MGLELGLPLAEESQRHDDESAPLALGFSGLRVGGYEGGHHDCLPQPHLVR